ncbi:MAG: tRNA nucleotidyltransferase, partial [Oscillospiraceae bacterium]
MELVIPQQAEEILTRLREAGYKAYPVGGCVRDMLLGLTPHDWDITTAAPPLKVMELLGDKKIIPTGIAHGTVTVINSGIPIEVTTFRSDGSYGDKR